jgi:hypothetical protein
MGIPFYAAFGIGIPILALRLGWDGKRDAKRENGMGNGMPRMGWDGKLISHPIPSRPNGQPN